jgi:hypothetical protein
MVGWDPSTNLPNSDIAAHNSQQDAEILRGTGISREASATAGV